MSSVAGATAPKGNISGYNIRNVPQFTPQMMQVFQQLLGSLQGGGGLEGGVDFLSKLASGDEGAFEKAEAPAYSAFNKMAGQIGSRYSKLGARDSSSFQQAISGGSAQLSENLGEKRLGIQTGAIDKLLGLSEGLLGQRPYETSLDPKPDWLKLIGEVLPQIIALFV